MSDKIKQAREALRQIRDMTSDSAVYNTAYDALASLDAQPEAEQPKQWPNVEQPLTAKWIGDNLAIYPVAAPVQPASNSDATWTQEQIDWVRNTGKKLAAKVKPAPVASDAPKQEPVSPHILEALSYHRFERDDLTLDGAVDVIRQGWKKVHGRTERQLVLQIAELLAAQPCQEPAQQNSGAFKRGLIAGREEAAKHCNSVVLESRNSLFRSGALACAAAIRSLQNQPAPEAGLSQPCQSTDKEPK